MKKITIISSNNDWYSNTYIEDEYAVKFLKSYIEKKGIESNPSIEDEHKLSLDISRNNNLLIKEDNGHKTFYIGENINNDQYIAFTDLGHGDIVAIYDWFDSTKEFNGYHIIEANDSTKNEKLYLQTKKNLYNKLMNSEKKSNRKSTK